MIADSWRQQPGTPVYDKELDSAGVLASPLGRWLDAAMDPSGKVIVNGDLSVQGCPRDFCDQRHDTRRGGVPQSSGFKSKQSMTMPGVAQPAIQEGKYVALVIWRRIAGKPAPAPFWYWEKGDLAIMGRTYVLADLRLVRFAGFLRRRS